MNKLVYIKKQTKYKLKIDLLIAQWRWPIIATMNI